MKDYLQVGDLVETARVTGVIVKIVGTDFCNRYHIALSKFDFDNYESLHKRNASLCIVHFEGDCMVVVFGSINFIQSLTPEEIMTFGHPRVQKLGKRMSKHQARWRWWYESKWYPRWMNIWKHV